MEGGMTKKIIMFVAICFNILVCYAHADEITVSPGDGTLQAAINSAYNGDTLILQDGSYSGTVTVNRSLTIRALNRSTTAIITNNLDINGSDIKVIIQGLKFTGRISLTKASSVSILENEFEYNYPSNSIVGNGFTSGTLYIIGNSIINGSIIYIKTQGAYIAGNTILDGSIYLDAYGWIVGNYLSYNNSSYNSTIETGKYYGENFPAYIIGNYIKCSGYSSCIKTNNTSLISNNIVEVSDLTNNYGHQYGIVAKKGIVKIRNNIIRGIPSNATRQGSALSVTAHSSQIVGNIVLNWASDDDACYFTSNPLEVTNNIWYDYSGHCPLGNGNQNIDPEFQNLSSYILDPGSPAIDAGPTDNNLADLDRTRNDMGVYGGPWSKDQYDLQRDPTNLAPFVYPMIMPDSFFHGGLFEMKALGVAKLR